MVWTFFLCRHLLEMTSHYEWNERYAHPQKIITNLGRCADDQITLLEKAQVSRGLSCKTNNLFSALEVAELLSPFSYSQVDHILIRLNANGSWLLAFAPKSEQSKFSADGFAASRRRTYEHIIISGIESLEDLCLDFVEGAESRRVDALELFVMEGRDRERLEVQQRRRRRELLRENEMFKGNR